jgi:hypothetical protein
MKSSSAQRPRSSVSGPKGAIALVNDTEYGLVAYAYTRDFNRGIRLSERVDVGMFGSNTGIVSNPAAPFGGVKHSGLGREGGTEGIEEFLEARYIAQPAARSIWKEAPDASIRPESVAGAMLWALDQPAGVDGSEVMIRATGQAF